MLVSLKIDTMEFPITREALQALNSDVFRMQEIEEENKKLIADSVAEICYGIKGMFRPNHERHTKMVWNGLSGFVRHYYNDSGMYVHCLALLLQKLRETFIDCDITVDPLNRFITIDWSLASDYISN